MEQAKTGGAGVHQIDVLPHITAKADPNVSKATNLRVDSFASPAKGILLTPGTGTTRRKTVSFGAITQSLECQPNQTLDPDDRIKPSEGEPSVLAMSKKAQSEQPRETSLNKKLFKQRNEALDTEIQKPFAIEAESSEYFEKPSEQNDTRAMKDKVNGGIEGDSEMTTDLKDPRSKSGQHWKREYSRYHEKSDHEMRKLIRHSQIAKSYAMKRDSEATNLNEKLKNSLAKVSEMEAKVAELAMQLAKGCTHEKDRVSDQADLMNQLATQTAQALRYKYKAEKYETAIREHGLKSGLVDHQCDEVEGKLDESPVVVADALPTQDQTAELKSLRSEVSSLRSAAESAEDKAAQLALENTTFKNTIRRVKEEMKKYEIRHKASEERRKQRDHTFKVQKRTLEANLAQCKMELENQIEQHRKEKADLIGDNGHMLVKGDKTNLGVTSQEQVIEDLQQQIRDLKEEVSNLQPDLLQNQQRKMSQELRQAREDLQKTKLENGALRLRFKATSAGNVVSLDSIKPQQHPIVQSSNVDVWTDMTRPNRRSRDVEQRSHPPPNADVRRIDNGEERNVQQLVLTEINSNNIEQRPLNRSEANDDPRSKYSEINLIFPHKPSPTTNISVPSTSSRRPSLLTYPSSPPTRRSSSYIPPRLHQPSLVSAANEVPCSKKPTDVQPTVGTNREIMMRGEKKSSLPPDRVAAARLRLEMRNQDKAKARSRAGKENSGG